MTSSFLLSLSTFAYLLCTILYLSGTIFLYKPLLVAGAITGLATLLVQTAGHGIALGGILQPGLRACAAFEYVRIAGFRIVGDNGYLSCIRVALQAAGAWGISGPFFFPGNGLRLLFKRYRFKDSAAGPRAEKQLADSSRNDLFSRLRCILGIFRVKHALSGEKKVSREPSPPKCPDGLFAERPQLEWFNYQMVLFGFFGFRSG